MFTQLTTAEVIQLLKTFKFKRKVNQWHIHHTWKPDYSDFNGKNHQQLQQSMKNYHVNTNGWSDIGQHFTLFPDGVWMLGRDLNKDPASILGWNTGAIAVEMVGNFDKGHDVMTKAQKDAIYEVTEFVIEQMKLTPHFHRDNPTSGKTCPGSGIDRDIFFKEVANFTENKLKEQQAAIDKQKEAEAKAKAERIAQIMKSIRIEFKDMIDQNTIKVHWANDYVNQLVDRNVVKGDPEGTFRPNDPATRAEVAAMIARAIESIEEKVLTKINEALKEDK